MRLLVRSSTGEMPALLEKAASAKLKDAQGQVLVRCRRSSDR